MDSWWPKDSAQNYIKTDQNVMVEIGDLIGAVSPEREQSNIKLSLARINDAELRLGAMISRHIKKYGTDGFGDSTYIVTRDSK